MNIHVENCFTDKKFILCIKKNNINYELYNNNGG